MAFSLTSTMTGATSDYAPYLYQDGQKITKTDKYQSSSLLDFALVPYDGSFHKLTRGAYVTVNSTTYPKWFTGFVTNDPDLTFLGKKAGVPVWGYVYHATSDEYVLSLNPLGIVPPFFNMTMGAILKSLATRCSPGTFDVTSVQDGPLVAQYVVEPTKRFADVVKEFCDAASYVFYGNDKKLYFKPQDDATLPVLVLDGNDANFTPSQLQGVRASASPLINDCTVLGDVEPQTYMHEYFVGNGLDGTFQLTSSVFGADSTVLIDESFGSSSIDSSKWAVYDTVAQYLQVSSGYLNALGGTSTGTYDVRIQSNSPLPMDGRIRFTHGEWDFLPGSGVGVIAGCWTAAPSSGLTGCLYGLKFASNVLNPVVSGAVDTTQSVAIDTSKRYVIRTLVEFTKLHRRSQGYNYKDNAGVVRTFGGTSSSDKSNWSTLVTEIDPATGQITNQWTMTSAIALTGTDDAYALYIPLASDNLHATVTGITVSVPINATLEWAKNVDFKNWNFDSWSDDLTPANWGSVLGVAREDTFVYSGSSCKMFPTLGVDPYVAQDASALIQARTPYNVAVKLLRTVGMTSGNVVVSLVGTGVSASYTLAASSISTGGFSLYSGSLTTGLSSIPTDLQLKVQLVGGVTDEHIWVDDVIVSTAYQAQLIGPNEIDAMDGMAPVATIVQANTGSSTSSTLLGSPQYNPGQAELVFFKNSITLESNVPALNTLVRLSYRSAGPAIGRVVDHTSVNAESAAWLDSGRRSVVRTDLSPRPRNASECESAAAVIVAENNYQHYEGQYTQWSTFFSSEPRAGAVVKFQNLSSVANFQVEEISQVVTTLESTHPRELFQHAITFGQPDHVQRFLSRAVNPVGAFQRAVDASAPVVIDVNSVGLVYADDVTKPVMTTWDDAYLYIDAGQDLPSNGLYFEVRYTDDGWGVDDGKNLVVRSTSRAFQVPRNTRGRMFYVRQVNSGNFCEWSEDQTQAAVYSGASRTKSTSTNPEGDIAQVCTVAFSGAGSSVTAAVLISGSTQYCWTFSARGTAGKIITANVGADSKTFTLSGYWQRFSVPFTHTGAATVNCVITAPSAFNMDVTRYSVEGGTSSERMYSKTTGSLYGPMSRYPAAVHVAFPTDVTADGSTPATLEASADTTLVPGNWLVKVDATVADVTITLPAYVEMSGFEVTVVKVAGSHDVVVATQSSDTINSVPTYTLTNINQSVTIKG